MNKTAIKNFAIWARNKLITDIQYRAGLMGITKDGVKDLLYFFNIFYIICFYNSTIFNYSYFITETFKLC